MATSAHCWTRTPRTWRRRTGPSPSPTPRSPPGRTRAAAGRRIVKLQTGDPDFATHEVVVAAACAAMRGGYLAAPARVTAQILKMSQYSITNVAPFAQRGAVAALGSPEVRAVSPEGAFYIMVDVSRHDRDSARFAARLLEEA